MHIAKKTKKLFSTVTLKKFFLKHKILLVIVALGLLLRVYRPLDLFMYSHDQDLLSWFVKDIVTNHNIRLIGQETSVKGVFIGPLWYYAAIPFYILFGMNPIGGLILAWKISVVTMVSIYWVISRMSNRLTGYIATFLYATSFYSVMTDREVVPTTPTILWSVWALFALHCFLQKKYKIGFVITGILVGLVWHISMGLILVIPLLALAYFSSFIFETKKITHLKDNFKYIAAGLICAAVLLSPLFIFEIRHSFSQTKSMLQSSASQSPQTFLMKLDRTTTLASKNIVGFTWGSYINLPNRVPLYLLIASLIFILYKKALPLKVGFALVLWCGLFIVFFSLNALNLSEYYLNGMLIVQLFVLSLFISSLSKKRNLSSLLVLVLFIFALINMVRLTTIEVNRSGFVYRQSLVQFIKSDANEHGYPCVSVSYITEPGFDLGYRYLYVINNMHVNQPSSNAPVYTIVFPHSRVSSIDKSFGALGIVLPDYQKYESKKVSESCSGENANLTDPLFGYIP